jgi:hypothetical protein
MRYGLLFIGLLSVLVGVLLTRFAAGAMRLHTRISAWPEAPGTVVRSEVIYGEAGRGSTVRPQITVRYTWGRLAYESSDHTHGVSFGDFDAAARRLVERYPVGADVSVRVQPGHPEVAVLDTGYPSHAVAVKRIGAALIAVGIGTAVMALSSAGPG